MAHGSWDAVVAELKGIYLPVSFYGYDEHARGVLNLISLLMGDTTLADILPGTSHGTLYLVIPGKRQRVYIWCDEADTTFTIYLYPHPLEDEHRVTVDNTQVLSTIRAYVDRVRSAEN